MSVRRAELQIRLAEVKGKFAASRPNFDGRGRRLWAAAEARALGHGGIVGVARATGMSHSTIRRGIAELAGGKPYSSTPAFSSHFISLKRKPAHTHFVDLVEPSPPAFIDRWERGSSELGVTTELH